jgi:sugar phosphate isomerase/epimerase
MNVKHTMHIGMVSNYPAPPGLEGAARIAWLIEKSAALGLTAFGFGRGTEDFNELKRLGELVQSKGIELEYGAMRAPFAIVGNGTAAGRAALKIACSTGIRSTESLDTACQVIAALGFCYVDPLAMEQWHVKPSRLVTHAAQEAKHVRTTFDRHRLKCVAVNLGFVNNFTNCTDKEHRTNLLVVEGACLLARSLGTTIITVSPGGIGNEDRQAILDRISKRLNDAIVISSGEGLTLALETHAGAIAVEPDAARELLRRCTGLKLTYHPSHYITEGIPVTETLDLLADAAHIHLRNARVGHFQERMDKGGLDIPWMIDQILASGCEGALSIEYIQDCGGIQEGYEVRDEAEMLKQLLLGKGLEL